MGKILNTPKECLDAFIMFILAVLGIVSAAGSFNYSVTEGWLYAVAGVVGIIDAVIAAVAFYKRYLKPTES